MPNSTNISPIHSAQSLMRKGGLEPPWAKAHKNLNIPRISQEPLSCLFCYRVYIAWHQIWHQTAYRKISGAEWILNPITTIYSVCDELRAAALKCWESVF